MHSKACKNPQNELACGSDIFQTMNVKVVFFYFFNQFNKKTIPDDYKIRSARGWFICNFD